MHGVYVDERTNFAWALLSRFVCPVDKVQEDGRRGMAGWASRRFLGRGVVGQMTLRAARGR